ncbi:hypothetical protein V5O48_017394 [Marasmius crinis-equi]|uniref:Uncharacterized protein n=1 Tax=Marasmius crinis-equi TaxID=585013 RepID=A0ABR3EP41_9AGAR
MAASDKAMDGRAKGVSWQRRDEDMGFGLAERFRRKTGQRKREKRGGYKEGDVEHEITLSDTLAQKACVYATDTTTPSSSFTSSSIIFLMFPSRLVRVDLISIHVE